MRILFPALLACALPALAAVDGFVTNRTVNLPQAGAPVSLYKMGQGGMEAVGQTKTDTFGKFTIAQAAEGPHLLQTVFEGVTYNLMLAPGTPTTGLKLDVFSVARKQPASVKVAQHMLLFEPGEGTLAVKEVYLLTNDGNQTWSDPAGGTLQFFLPAAAKGEVQVNATAPNGLPVRRTAASTGRGDTYKLDFAIKPGETRIDLSYSVPFTGGAYKGRIVMKDEATRVVTPKGVTIKGEGLTEMGPDPRSQAMIYDLKTPNYSFEIAGTGSLAAAKAGEGGAEGGEQESSGPSIEQILPRINGNVTLILALAFGILALGFVLLYRAREQAPAAAKEANERRRR